MTAKVFVDSNILVYAHDADAGPKTEDRRCANQGFVGRPVGPYQHTSSTGILCDRHAGAPETFSQEQAREIVRDYAQWVAIPTTPQTVIRASEISEGWRLSFWDSLILAAAEEQDCSTVLTEDLNAGQTVAGIRVINPFLQTQDMSVR